MVESKITTPYPHGHNMDTRTILDDLYIFNLKMYTTLTWELVFIIGHLPKKLKPYNFCI